MTGQSPEWRSAARVACAITILALVAASPAGAQPSASPARDTVPLAITGVHVVDVDSGRIVRNRTVVIRDGRIEAVGHRDSVAPPPNARIIPGDNRFLMPGLMDLHSHAIDPEILPVYIARGVTTVQMLNAGAEVLDWEDSVTASGGMTPRLIACAGGIRDVKTAEDAKRVVSDHQKEGFSCLKPYGGFTEESYVALITEARRLGMRTVSHIPRGMRWQDALAFRGGCDGRMRWPPGPRRSLMLRSSSTARSLGQPVWTRSS
jgi:hypothetical protein